MVRQQNSDLWAVDDDTLFSVGKAICLKLDRGGSFGEIVRSVVESDLDSAVAATIIVGAVEELCPGHRQFLDNYLNQ